MVSDETIAHVRHLFPYKTVRQFKSDLEFLLKKYKPLALTEVIKHIRDARPFPRRTFLLTFDDGYREMSEVVAPILLDKGVSATFFVNSAFVDNQQLGYWHKLSIVIAKFEKGKTAALEKRVSQLLEDYGIHSREIAYGIMNIRCMSAHAIDAIANLLEIDWGNYLRTSAPFMTSSQIDHLLHSGFTIGGHSVDHSAYASLALDAQLKQTIESVRFVKERFHLDYGAFAFPFSDDQVSREFFGRMYHNGVVDVSFGTAGLVRGCERRHIQRICFESPIAAAEQIVAFQCARYLLKTMRTKISDIITPRCT